MPWHEDQQNCLKVRLGLLGIFTSSLSYGNDFSSPFTLYFSYILPCLDYFCSILVMLIMSPRTQTDAQWFLQSVQAILTPPYPIWGMGMETNSSDQNTASSSCVLCPMTWSHTSQKSTETLTNFEGKFCSTYLFWVDLLFEDASFFLKVHQMFKLWSSPWNLLLSVHPCCAREQKSQPISVGNDEFSKSSLDVLVANAS